MASLFAGACLLAATGLTTVSSLLPPAATPPGQLRTAPYAGVYTYGTGSNGATGRLTIYPESDSTFLFYLDLNNGAPAYSSGQLLQRAVVYGTGARCAFNAGYSPTAGCQLQFTRQAAAVLVQTVTGQAACGFGNGVHADHTYQRISSGVPTSFRDGNGKTVLFKGLQPEQYNR